MIMLLGNARKVEELSLRPDLLLFCSCLNERALGLELLGRIAVRLALRIYVFFFVPCWNISPNDVLQSFTIYVYLFGYTGGLVDYHLYRDNSLIIAIF